MTLPAPSNAFMSNPINSFGVDTLSLPAFNNAVVRITGTFTINNKAKLSLLSTIPNPQSTLFINGVQSALGTFTRPTGSYNVDLRCVDTTLACFCLLGFSVHQKFSRHG